MAGMTKSLAYRCDKRSQEEFIANVRKGNRNEEEIARRWCESHNRIVTDLNAPFNIGLSFEPIGDRDSLLPELPHDGGDVLIRLDDEFETVVEIKPVPGMRDQCRPMEDDVILCIRENRPYIVAMHYTSPRHLSLIYFTVDDLKQIQKIPPITEDPVAGEPYGGKPYHWITDSLIYMDQTVRVRDLNPMRNYIKLLSYLRECKQ